MVQRRKKKKKSGDEQKLGGRPERATRAGGPLNSTQGLVFFVPPLAGTKFGIAAGRAFALSVPFHSCPCLFAPSRPPFSRTMVATRAEGSAPAPLFVPDFSRPSSRSYHLRQSASQDSGIRWQSALSPTGASGPTVSVRMSSSI